MAGFAAARPVLLRDAVMTPITFGTKRAYHGFLRFTRRAFASVGLTAARYDLLLAIRGSVRGEKHEEEGIAQYYLPSILGVSKSVVSRMVKALVKLGLVAWCRSFDRRYHQLFITAKGEAVFLAARDLLMRCVKRVVVTAACFGRPSGAKQRKAQVQQLTNFLAALRVYFGDTAPLEYDWSKRAPLDRTWGPPAMTLRGWAPAGDPACDACQHPGR